MIHCQQINTHVNMGSTESTGIMAGYPTGKICRDPTGIKVGPTGKIGWDPTGKICRDPIGKCRDPTGIPTIFPMGPTGSHFVSHRDSSGSHWDSRSNFHWGYNWLVHKHYRSIWKELMNIYCTGRSISRFNNDLYSWLKVKKIKTYEYKGKLKLV